jgi:hypothetical protein
VSFVKGEVKSVLKHHVMEAGRVEVKLHTLLTSAQVGDDRVFR